MNQYEWYEVTYQIPGIHKRPQVMTAQFLGIHGSEPYREYIFNLRPLAGTQALRVEYMIGDPKPLGPKAKPKLPRAVATA